MPVRLIVNADDFGLTEGVSRGISEAMRAGRVTSTTILANRPHLAACVRLLDGIDDVGVGVHLALSSGRPVLPADQVPSLIDESGAFPRDYRFAVMNADLREVEAEWQCQIETALGYGLNLTHLDSHHHIHLHPKFTPVAVRLAQVYGIGALRSASVPDLETPVHQFTSIITAREAGESGRLIRKSGLKTVDRLLTGLKSLADLPRDFQGVAELCCHPGYDDGELQAISSLTAAREEELLYLLSEHFEAALQEVRAKLTHYGAI